MGTLHHHPFLIRYQGGAGDHVVQIRAGCTIRSGVGQSFWLRAGRCALAEVPTANRAHSFLVQVPSADQQNVSAQVAITYRIEDAEAAASHYDFDLYPARYKQRGARPVADRRNRHPNRSLGPGLVHRRDASV